MPESEPLREPAATPTPAWPRRALLAALEVVWWWAAAVAVWTLTLSSVPDQELVAAAACGLPCGIAARAGRKAVAGSWRPRPGWAAWLLPLLAAVPVDTVRLLLLTMRQLRRWNAEGELTRVRLPAEPPDVVAARHAAAVLVVSATPGTFVVDSDLEEGTLVIHNLVSGWPQLEQVVRR
ncbi:MAG TPA: hypothetical protein VG164_09135 [Trebonia sp.]|jgi:multisubunit Na+/H+ antiporter MnhE subunit|nr:hypothetical protein [Trebonia sp.]